MRNIDFSGGLIVSCQAPEESPLRDPYVMAQMALAAEKAGAVGIRAEGVEDIRAIRAVCALPVIGILKKRRPGSDVFITATRRDVDVLADTGVEVIAVDATMRKRPEGETLNQVMSHAKDRGLMVLADLALVTDAGNAAGLGADFLGTTLFEESTDDIRRGGPNIAAVREIVMSNSGKAVIGEGRYATPGDIVGAFESGATSVVVGRAITDAYALTISLVEATPRFNF